MAVAKMIKKSENGSPVAQEIKTGGFKRIPLGEDGKLLKNGWGVRSPRNLVIVKYPKSGSTLSLCNVPKVLIADSEKGTETFKPSNVANLIDETVSDKFVHLPKYGWIPQTIFDLVDELKRANNMPEYWKRYNALENERDFAKKEGLYNSLIEHINTMPFPILAIDTITSITGLSNAAALYDYNLGVKETSQKADIKRVDEYGGTMYIRRKFDEVKRFIEGNAAPFIQFHGHVATRKKVLKKGEDEINALDIALEGLLSTIFTAKANAVCTFKRDDEGCWLDFIKQDETDLGSRNLQLSNRKIRIADIADNEDIIKNLLEGLPPVKSYWADIYPEINF